MDLPGIDLVGRKAVGVRRGWDGVAEKLIGIFWSGAGTGGNLSDFSADLVGAWRNSAGFEPDFRGSALQKCGGRAPRLSRIMITGGRVVPILQLGFGSVSLDRSESSPCPVELTSPARPRHRMAKALPLFPDPQRARGSGCCRCGPSPQGRRRRSGRNRGACLRF